MSAELADELQRVQASELLYCEDQKGSHGSQLAQACQPVWAVESYLFLSGSGVFTV